MMWSFLVERSNVNESAEYFSVSVGYLPSVFAVSVGISGGAWFWSRPVVQRQLYNVNICLHYTRHNAFCSWTDFCGGLRINAITSLLFFSVFLSSLKFNSVIQLFNVNSKEFFSFKHYIRNFCINTLFKNKAPLMYLYSLYMCGSVMSFIFVTELLWTIGNKMEFSTSEMQSRCCCVSCTNEKLKQLMTWEFLPVLNEYPRRSFWRKTKVFRQIPHLSVESTAHFPSVTTQGRSWATGGGGQRLTCAVHAGATPDLQRAPDGLMEGWRSSTLMLGTFPCVYEYDLAT